MLLARRLPTMPRRPAGGGAGLRHRQTCTARHRLPGQSGLIRRRGYAGLSSASRRHGRVGNQGRGDRLRR
eukprot:scaffold4853_cov105-Isochrysis_galbana.AAC.2